METELKEGSEAKKEGEGEAKETFEIKDKAIPDADDKKVTLGEAKEAGWSDEELKLGEESGHFKTEATEEEKAEEAKRAKEQEESEDAEKQKEKTVSTNENKQKPQSADDFLLTPDEEKLLSEMLDKNSNVSSKLKNVSANYWGRKGAVSRAQSAEAERDRILNENQELKDRLKKAEEAKPVATEDDDLGDDGEDRPLTKKSLKEMLAKEKEEEIESRRKNKEATDSQAKKINEALQIQENHAKNIYPDFDKVVNLGEKLIGRNEKGVFKSEVNITTLPEHAKKRAIMLVKGIQSAAHRADSMTINDVTVADLSYELGKLAAEYIKEDGTAGHSADTTGQRTERTSGGLTPEDEERIRKNKSRTGSSASLSGAGGKRVVSVDEISVEDLNEMDAPTFDAFQLKHPEKVEELQRG